MNCAFGIRSSVLLALVAVAIVGPKASAATIGVTSGGDIISPTAGGALPNFFNDATSIVHGWNEQQNVILGKDIYVDINSNGTYNQISDLGGFNALKIAAGTAVSSHLLYFDPRNSKSAVDVTFTFSAPILGVIVESDRFYTKGLGFTDYFVDTDFLRNPLTPATNYPTSHFANRGLELGSPNDEIVVTILGPSVRITRFDASNPGDQVRIITMADVPEPSTMVLGIVAFGTSGAFARWRSRQQRASRD
jgi:hypothetical protein